MVIAIIIAAIIVAVISPLIVAAILFFPYAFIFFKRKKMLKHLYKTAELCGYRVRPLRKHVAMSKNTDGIYDILIENSERAYAIKLWSAKSTENTLMINRDGTFFESSVVPAGLSRGEDDQYVITGKAQSVPVTRCNFKVKKTKVLELVMLYYPENEHVYIDLGDKRAPLREGQILFGKTVLSPEYLEMMLRKYRKTAKPSSEPSRDTEE
jgi:hypothetical protein